MRPAMRVAARAGRLMAAAGSPGTGPERPRPEPAPRIGTHDGTFHCDEVLACYLLRLLPQYRDAEVLRTRDPQLLARCDVVVDVGGEYDPKRHRYDHHQRSFSESMRSLRPDKPWTTKLSSAGLVYCHFGSQILAGLLGQPEDGPVVTALYDKLYENFVEEIDAMDNGIAQAEGEPRYAVTTTLSARVAHLNPRWNDPPAGPRGGVQTGDGAGGERVPGAAALLPRRVAAGARAGGGGRAETLPGGRQRGGAGAAGGGLSLEGARFPPGAGAGAAHPPSSWCFTPTARGSGGCRASPRGHTPSRAGSRSPSPGAGCGTSRCPSSPASPAASSSTPAASPEGTARGRGLWRWRGGRWRCGTGGGAQSG
ncbi:hypothetical protein Q9966_016181 [Columba livia]|nr:hypothetical protein Q9966_016181 [Columba livia]